MKDISTKINESKDSMKKLDNLVYDFMELFDEIDDDSREQLCVNLVDHTIHLDEEQYTKGRVKECWKYVADNLIGKWH